MQGKIGQMVASDERHLPANMVSYFLAQACGRDRRPGGRFCAVGMSFRFRSVLQVQATDSQETSCLSTQTGYRFGSHS
jgi:hypothetical protein